MGEAYGLAFRLPDDLIAVYKANGIDLAKFNGDDSWRSSMPARIVIRRGRMVASAEADPLGRIFDAFGLNRCMWGTDWTRAVALLTYEQGVEAFRVTDRLSDSDRAILMGETISRIRRESAKLG